MAGRAWIPMKCSSSLASFTGSFENVEGTWNLRAGTIVSSERPGQATSEGRQMTGAFGISPDYRGCPSCSADGYAKCGKCGRLSCWGSSNPRFRCGFCSHEGDVSGSIQSAGASDWS